MDKYCTNCGEKLVDSNASFCSKCGHAVNGVVNNNTNSDSKSRLGAGLLAIFLGSLGIHNFYLGYTNKGVAQILLTLVGWIAFGLGPVAAAIWALVEGIEIFAGTISTDANGVPLKD